MTRAFETGFVGEQSATHGTRPGFFAWVDGAPAEGYRSERVAPLPPSGARRDERPVTVVTGAYGALVLAPLVAGHPRSDVEVLAVDNAFFGGNIGVAGLLTGSDLTRALSERPAGRRHLVPDACLSEGRFLDGQTPDDLPVPVEVVPADGRSLRAALDGWVGGVVEPARTASVLVSLGGAPAGAGAR